MKKIFILIALFVFFSGCECVKKECMEYKEYCYYKQGSGTQITSNGGITLGGGSVKVYVRCEDQDIIPKKVYKQKRCIKFY